MKAFLPALNEALRTVLGHPGSQVELWTLLALSVVVSSLVLRPILSALECRGCTGKSAFTTILVGGFLILAVMALAGITILPKAGTGTMAKLIPWISMVFGAFAFAFPLCCLFNRSTYIQSMIAYSLSMLAVLFVVLLLGAGFDVIRASSKTVSGIKADKERTRDSLME